MCRKTTAIYLLIASNFVLPDKKHKQIKNKHFQNQNIMKKSVQLFALVLVGFTFFSCTTDEYDAALEESVKVTENIQNAQFKEGEEQETQSAATTEDGTPILVTKKD